jgi:hypothetical protein
MHLSQTKTITMWTLVLLVTPPLANGQTSSPQQTDQRLAQQPTPPTPLPLGVDGQLASWLHVRGEFRTRIEGFSGGAFADNVDGYWMDRFRLNATVRPSKTLAFVVQAQDARAFQKSAASQAAPFRGTFDLRMAYGEFGTKHTIRVGRQELAFGEQRLLGHLIWANTARSFDGARATIRGAFGQIEAFAASVVAISPGGFDKSGGGNLVSGAYASFVTPLPNNSVEPYFLWRQSRDVTAELGGVAPLHQATSGLRMAGRLPLTFDYSVELALQTGSVGPDEIRAWAGHGAVGRLLGASRVTRVFGEYNYASGDADHTDGRRGTFDQLYPTGHDKLGLSDQVGWRNIHHARTGLEVRPAPKWLISGGYHSWWLASTTDGLYNAGGALVARSAAGTPSRHVGHEIDGRVAYTYSPQLQVDAGYAHVLPGEFLKGTTPGRAYRYPYVMVTYAFLGEQPVMSRRRH